MKQPWVIGLKIAVSGCLIVLIYRNTPIDQIRALLINVDTAYLLPIAVLLFFNTIISAKKWQLFLAADGVEISLIGLVNAYMRGTFCNLFLPSSIGGDTYRVYEIAQQSRQGVRSAASVFADRFSGFIALVSLSLLSAIYIAVNSGQVEIIAVPLLLSLVFFTVILFLTNRRLFTRILELTRINRISVVARLAEKLLLSFDSYRTSPRLLVKVMALSFLFQLSLIFSVFLMACSLGARVSFIYFSTFVPLINLMEALPISIYGIGVRDYGYVFFFTQVGMSDVETRSLALLFMAITVCYSLVGGLLLIHKMWRRPRAS